MTLDFTTIPSSESGTTSGASLNTTIGLSQTLFDVVGRARVNFVTRRVVFARGKTREIYYSLLRQCAHHMVSMDRPKLSKSQKKAVEDGKLVETVNSLGHADFTRRFLEVEDVAQTCEDIAYKTDRQVTVDLMFAENLKSSSKNVFDSCFKLIQESSAADYAASEVKWSAPSKRREMVLPDMRYLVLRGKAEDDNVTLSAGQLADQETLGFVSFMITYEDGFEVLYVYEIHLCEDFRGQGVGTLLMNIVEDIGRKAGVEKCMLTVFKSNKKAVKWYERCGYTLDDFSPRPRVLRNGRFQQPTYLILSKTFLRV